MGISRGTGISQAMQDSHSLGIPEAQTFQETGGKTLILGNSRVWEFPVAQGISMPKATPLFSRS